jgi:hypothetical protein
VLVAATDHVEIAILTLLIVGVATMLATSALIVTMLVRQQNDLADNRRIATAIIDLSVQIEAEERRGRHAVKNLCATLSALLAYWKELPVKADFSSIGDPLVEPMAPSEHGELVHRLVAAREAAGVEEAAIE